MLSFLIFCCVWFLQIVLSCCDQNSTDRESGGSRSVARLPPAAGIRLSVPENHRLCLQCGTAAGSDVVWTHGGTKLLMRTDEPDGDERRRRSPRPDGRLCFEPLDDCDSGWFGCNGRRVAELQVLTGDWFQVVAGWTLLLPCRSPPRTRQRWFHRRGRGRWEPVLTRFKNGSVKPEREGGRHSFDNDALQIRNLRPDDAGEYQCNAQPLGRVTVLPGPPDPTGSQSSRTSTPAAVTQTAAKKKKKKKETKGSENALLLLALVGFALMILLLVSVCFVLVAVRCRRKNGRKPGTQRSDVTELRPWTSAVTQTEYEVFESPCGPEENLHYASLGRQNWGERPTKTPLNQDHQDIVYSAVMTRPEN
ncbi:hypothetical protein Q5P01_018840 [Channa striata]|uniref:Immunoglobulin domain-containing protein n=1 Tax=Channa striata TaxID=64152 RepID=A0AA88M5G0_CHASR|nr:hypothetical protein Q5P01_018840 [Channa striata]